MTLIEKLNTVDSLEELAGFEGQLVKDGRLDKNLHKQIQRHRKYLEGRLK